MTVAVRSTWQEHAACIGLHDVMYPTATSGPGGSADWQPAKDICATCPVTDACLDHAISINELDNGMWGGLTPDERRVVAGRAPLRNPTIAARVAVLDARIQAAGIEARALSLAMHRDRGWWSHVRQRRTTSSALLDRVEAYLDSIDRTRSSEPLPHLAAGP